MEGKIKINIGKFILSYVRPYVSVVALLFILSAVVAFLQGFVSPKLAQYVVKILEESIVLGNNIPYV
ncbi:MAG: hypothetical protein LBR35_00270, partial [Rickettsiales bacterium]|nr:hypothetical protein [Rickettsiales bacterium]